jgi:hypothetical protein
MCTEPLALWGHAEALAQRSKKGWARNIQWLLDTRYLTAEKAVLVMDKLNTHTPSWLYETVRACSNCGFLRSIDRKNPDFRALRTFGSMEPARENFGVCNAKIPDFEQALTPEEAFRLVERLGIRFTPKHGRRLEIAGMELSALAARCLGLRRIGSIQGLNVEVLAWHTQGEEKGKGVDWQYTAGDARITLKGLYPEIVE